MKLRGRVNLARDGQPSDGLSASVQPRQVGVVARVWAVLTHSSRTDPIVEPRPSMDNELLARRLRVPIHTSDPTVRVAKTRRKARRTASNGVGAIEIKPSRGARSGDRVPVRWPSKKLNPG